MRYLARCVLLFLCLWLPSLHLGAQPAAQPPFSERQLDQAAAYGPLFAFSKAGRTHYLYGTMHIGKPEYAVPDRALWRALQDSDALLVEIDPGERDTLTELLNQAQRNAAGQWRLLTEENRRIMRQLAPREVSAEQLRRFAPGLWLSQLAVGEFRKSGLSPDYGRDMQLLSLARRQGRKVVALETARQQGELLLKLPAGALNDWVRQTRDWQGDQAEAYNQTLIQAWERGDLAALQAMIEQPGYEKFGAWMQEVMLDRRNLAMAEGIERLASAQRVFVAVGALHLAGPQGLVRLLRQRGYAVKAVDRS
ncbi:hypothetical protein CEK28_05775 [Xenophilus sp. AP218F]|nr:TraB/GumN family protein [Chromobacterium sp. ASV5]OWY40236.1 hypothetical protein CEK28_05775 [Xenophilus sp. AP218F]